MRLPIAISDRPPRGVYGDEVMVLNALVEPLDWIHPFGMEGAAPSDSGNFYHEPMVKFLRDLVGSPLLRH